MAPAFETLFEIEDRCVAHQRMTLLAAGLRWRRLTHGEYPDSLDALAPEPLTTIPLDPFSNEPFRYERRGDGFVLYSVGENGRDDGGSDAEGDFVRGEHAPVDWVDERDKPQGVDDLVVRLPVPPVELPPAAGP